MTSIKEQVEAIVKKGDDVRKQVAKAVADATSVQIDKKGLIDLSRSVVDGAANAFQKAVPRDPNNVLRQVIDGLGDGLSTAALASRLAVEEAQARGESFAEGDLKKLTTDLRAISDLFVDTVSQATVGFKTLTKTEVAALRTHSEQVIKRVRPAVESALSAIAGRPLQFGKESIAAGIELSTQAIGALFSAIGRRMDEAGKRLVGSSA